jgi:hypothetical protein
MSVCPLAGFGIGFGIGRGIVKSLTSSLYASLGMIRGVNILVNNNSIATTNIFKKIIASNTNGVAATPIEAKQSTYHMCKQRNHK